MISVFIKVVLDDCGNNKEIKEFLNELMGPP
jgi:hypothetical protein